jgi:hypothetical protein
MTIYPEYRPPDIRARDRASLAKIIFWLVLALVLGALAVMLE